MTNYNVLSPLDIGDQYVPAPSHVWETATPVPRDAEAVWKWGVSRFGLVGEEEGVGYLLPKRLERALVLPRWQGLRSIGSLALEEDELPPQRKVGDTLRDFPKASSVKVVEIDHDTRTMVLDSHWDATEKRGSRHYSWAINVGESQSPDISILATRMRWETPFKSWLSKYIVPPADAFGMKLYRDGLIERLPKQ